MVVTDADLVRAGSLDELKQKGCLVVGVGGHTVAVYWHDSARPGEPEAYRVPGMENETILPPSDNLADKGRPRLGRPPAAGTPHRSARSAHETAGPVRRRIARTAADPTPGRD